MARFGFRRQFSIRGPGREIEGRSSPAKVRLGAFRREPSRRAPPVPNSRVRELREDRRSSPRTDTLWAFHGNERRRDRQRERGGPFGLCWRWVLNLALAGSFPGSGEQDNQKCFSPYSRKGLSCPPAIWFGAEMAGRKGRARESWLSRGGLDKSRGGPFHVVLRRVRKEWRKRGSPAASICACVLERRRE